MLEVGFVFCCIVEVYLCYWADLSVHYFILFREVVVAFLWVHRPGTLDSGKFIEAQHA